MTRVPAIVIGLFLLAVWIGGLSVHSAAWLTWLNGVGAVIAFIIAGVPTTREGEGAMGRSGLSIVLTLGLFALWIIGLVVHAQTWIVWCTFAAACASALLAFGGGTRAVQRRTV